MSRNAIAETAEPSRRRFLRMAAGTSAVVGGLTILSACKDDVVGAESVPSPTPSGSATVAVPPAYTATDNDRLNFALQIHYLLANFLLRSLDGSSLSANLTSGSGALGTVAGGRAVGFTDPALTAQVREVAAATIARIGYLRRTLGSAVTAQPALNINGGKASPFQATASTDTAATVFFDPYASEDDFLLGAVALFAVATSVGPFLAWQMGQSLRGSFNAFSAGTAASDAIMRSALYLRASLGPRTPATGQKTLFTRANEMSVARNSLDGPLDLDQGIGSFSGQTSFAANLTISEGNWIQIRRSPEQALGVLYASAASVPSGGFYPSGMNGVIKVSGANL